MVGCAASSQNMRYISSRFPSHEAGPLIERFAHSGRREISPSSLVVGKTPTCDECAIATEQVEEKHRLQDIAHDEDAVLTVPGERELEARTERVERPHPENLDNLHVLVLGRDLAEEIGQVHGILDDTNMQFETSVRGHDVESPIAQELFLGMKGFEDSRESLSPARGPPLLT